MSRDVNRSLYPDIEPYDTGFLKVSDIHTVYYEQSGNPGGHVSFCYLYILCTGLTYSKYHQIYVCMERVYAVWEILWKLDRVYVGLLFRCNC